MLSGEIWNRKILFHVLNRIKPDMVVYAYTSRTWEAEANSRSAWCIQKVIGQPGIHRKTMTKEKQKQKQKPT